MHVRCAYLIQFGNIMPIERINDYREDMKLSGPAGRVNCHYPLFPIGGKREREREDARGFLGPHPTLVILIINRTRSSSQSATVRPSAISQIYRVSPSTWNIAQKVIGEIHLFPRSFLRR